MTNHDQILDTLGGTTAVAKLIGAPVSTVHSWRKKGIPAWRIDQLKLKALANDLPWPGEAA